MKEYLIKLKLIDFLTVVLEMNREDFVDNLSAITDNEVIGMFSEGFGAFSSNNNEFIGQINATNFKIKRRNRFMESNQNIAVASGTFSENNGQLIIETEINGIHSFLIFMSCVMVLFISVPIFLSIKKGEYFALPLLLVFAAIALSGPYLAMKGSVKRLKYELEREFFFLTKK
jgi:hypothetical protein